MLKVCVKCFIVSLSHLLSFPTVNHNLNSSVKSIVEIFFLLFFHFGVQKRVQRVADSVGTHMKVAQVLVVIDWINLASGTE